MLKTVDICGRSQERTARRKVTAATESNETAPRAEPSNAAQARVGLSPAKPAMAVATPMIRKAPQMKCRRPVLRAIQPRPRVRNSKAVQLDCRSPAAVLGKPCSSRYQGP